MYIKSIHLNNIRTYLDDKIELPNDTVLLKGDVGVGKSTILMAIDFALFGFLGEDLTGNQLLRASESNGFIELEFEIEGKEVIVKRTLRRRDKGVSQDIGYILINGKKEQKSPIELKSEILSLLGFPEKLLSKRKSMIYRYTVYTPQEQMRRILTSSEEERIEVLRKIFGIDRYKQIRDNMDILRKAIDAKREYLEGIAVGAEEKINEKKDLEKELNDMTLKLSEIKKSLDEIHVRINEKKDEKNKLEVKIQEANSVRQKISRTEGSKKAKEMQVINIKKMIEESGRRIDEMKARVESYKEIKMNTDPDLLEKEITEMNESIRERETKIKMAHSVISKIESLDKPVCPICFQNVSSEHKKNIIYEERKKIKAYSDEINSIIPKRSEKQKLLSEFREYEKRAKEKENEERIMQDRIKQKEELLSQKEVLEIEIVALNNEVLSLNEKLKEYSDAEKSVKEIEKDMESLMSAQIQKEKDYARSEENAGNCREKINHIELEIKNKISAKNEAIKLASYQRYIKEQFIPLMVTMEKQILSNIRAELSAEIQKWFVKLIPQNTMTIDIDDRFNPVIEQEGYHLEYSYLSGGERTSIALSYRLALNKVMNTFIEKIKTKDILILDEPTEGFSREQLIAFRDIINELKGKQTIIVSHESEMDSFVGHIINIAKLDNISRVV